MGRWGTNRGKKATSGGGGRSGIDVVTGNGIMNGRCTSKGK